jgi:hypothetical protein
VNNYHRLLVVSWASTRRPRRSVTCAPVARQPGAASAGLGRTRQEWRISRDPALGAGFLSTNGIDANWTAGGCSEEAKESSDKTP